MREAYGGGVEVQRLPELREQDFGSLEGLPWQKPVPPVGDGWVDPETTDAILRRVDRFLDEHLFPAMRELLVDGGGEGSIVVAAHGMTLGHLLRALVAKFRRDKCPVYGLVEEGQVHWKNTGYLECLVEAAVPELGVAESFPSGLRVTVERVNCVDHLAGLSRTKGGIGSAAFDAGQKTLDTFFTKKQ